jgi:hypothetical protein
MDLQLTDAIEPPPDNTYSSYEDALNSLKTHGKHHGYGFHIYLSRPSNSNFKTRYYYRCDKAKQYQSQASVRSTSTRKTGCPFKLVIFKMKSEDDQPTSDQWRLEVTNAEHNHDPSLHPSAHHVYHKRTAAQTETIRAMSDAGTRPMQVLTALQQQDPDTVLTADDVRNDRKKLRREHLNGRSPIEALLDDLSTPEWIFDVKRDSENRVQYLFFAHQKQIELQLANPDVLMMDCTYRTNKYKMPLLHILGCTNLATFFSAGFCFLRNETHMDYHWAVSTFLHKTGTPQPRVFLSDHEDALKLAVTELLPRVPQLLCVWHINKNVQTKVQLEWRTSDAKTKEEKEVMEAQRSAFMSRWAQIVYSKTEAEFEAKWKALQADYQTQGALCMYLEKNQYPTRHQWASAWTSQHRHYNTTSTSPIEGSHKVLKDYLQTSKGDLLYVVKNIEHMVLNQYNRYRNQLASARNTIKHAHRLEKMPFLPPDIHSTITPPAIEHVRKQHELRKKHQRERCFYPCTGTFERINGLPCYHTLQSMENIGSPLQMRHFDDDHWHYRRREGHSILPPPPRQYQFVQEPLTIQSRGAPRKSEASTRRMPSAFERPVPATSTPPQPAASTQALPRIEATATATATTSSSPEGVPVTAVSVSISAPVLHLPSPPQPCYEPYVHLSSPISSSDSNGTFMSALDGAGAPQQPVWQPPTLEEFEEDIRCRQLDPILRQCNDPATLANFLAETGQENDTFELIQAREMALDTIGIFADCTPRMAWNYCFGDKNAFFAERSAQIKARDALLEAELTSNQPTKRPAPEAGDATMEMRATKKPRRCKNCHQEGHYAKTCPASSQGPLAMQEEQAIADSLDVDAGPEEEPGEDAVVVVGGTSKKKRCGTCHEEGHNSRTCTIRRQRSPE